MKQIRIANEQDIERVTAFLEEAEVSSAGVETIIDHFILMEDGGGAILATLGIERLEKDGLLRSLVISPKLDQTNLLALFKGAISLAKQKELDKLYLATNKQASVKFFEMLHFSKIDETDLPTHIQSSTHISRLFESTDPMFMVSNVM